MSQRVIVLLDMDCFYCQVEALIDPSLVGVPSAVVQHNDWRGGGIIAVNYEARAFGVTRNMRGEDAKEKCPQIRLVRVPMEREKADLSKYREAGKKVISAISEFNSEFVIERASVDEAYLDITAVVDAMEAKEVQASDLPNTWVVGFDKAEVSSWMRNFNADDARLAVGARIMEQVRQAVFEKTGYRCSAGIAHNKILAKISCGLHKPNQQTVLPHASVPILYDTLKLTKLRGLGGKFGDQVTESLQIQTAKELSMIPLKRLQNVFDEKTSLWLYKLGQGLDDEPVKERELPKSIGCSKNFRGPKNRLDTVEKVKHWLKMLADELSDRLVKEKESNSRIAKTINISLGVEGHRGSLSRGGQLNSYDAEGIAQRGFQLIQKLNTASHGAWRPTITLLSLNASKFEDAGGRVSTSIINFLSAKKTESEPPVKNMESSTDDFSFSEASTSNDVIKCEPSGSGSSEPVEYKSTMGVDPFYAFNVNSEESIDESIQPPLPVASMPDNESNAILTDESYYSNIDPSILESLPPEIKSEIQSEMKRRKSESEKCPQCGLQVSPFELPEHLDYHTAKDLQKDLSRCPPPVVISKRKTSESDSKNSKKQKNILSFFNKI